MSDVKAKYEGKAKSSWRSWARALGVNHAHLYRVVKGERSSPELMRRYEELRARSDE